MPPIAAGILIALVAVLALVVPGDAGAQPRPCTIMGTPGDDYRVGTPGNDVICGRGGDDVIEPGAGNDVVRGGTGEDRIHDRAGRDRLFGESGDDSIGAREGRDRVEGGPGHDRLDGGLGADRILGHRGNDTIHHGYDRARDRIDGGPGRDRAHFDRRDRVASAGLLRDNICTNADLYNSCITMYNDSSDEAVFQGDRPSECNGDYPPENVDPGTNRLVYCSVEGGTPSFSYVVDDGATPYQIALYIPPTTFSDPWLNCELSQALQRGTLATTCIPIYIGDGGNQESSLYFEPASSTNPPGLGAGQSCTVAPSQSSDCLTMGALLADNSGEASFQGLGPGPAQLQIYNPGSTSPDDTETLDQGDVYENDFDSGTTFKLSDGNGSGSGVIVTEVKSYGHDDF